MKQPYYKAQHEVFIRAIISHGNQLKAYWQAYPKAKKECAYTAAIRLLRQPHIRERVEDAMQLHAQRQRERERERAEQKRLAEEEDVYEKRRFLTQVIDGKIRRPRNTRLNESIVTVYEDLSPFVVLRAIELDTKYEQGYSPKIILDRQFARLYLQATRTVGITNANAQTSPSPAGFPLRRGNFSLRINRRTIPPPNLASAVSRAQRVMQEMKEIPPLKGDVAAPLQPGDVHKNTNTQNARKKLTVSAMNPLQTMPPASNKRQGSNNLPNNTATLQENRYSIMAVISNEVKCSGTQREISREHAIGNTAATQEISLPKVFGIEMTVLLGNPGNHINLINPVQPFLNVHKNTNTQNVPEKLTDPFINPPQSMPPASNKKQGSNSSQQHRSISGDFSPESIRDRNDGVIGQPGKTGTRQIVQIRLIPVNFIQ